VTTLTPADLALAAGRSQKRVRAVLRSLYGTLPLGVSRWELSEEQFAAALAVLKSDRGPREWSLEIGDTVRRRQVHEAYGGQQQGGISTPRSAPEILIFTDPVSGARYGYDKHEGLRENGSYFYTGEGQHGPQTFIRGNLALRDAALTGKTIRLFTTKGTAATYVGAFTTGDPVYKLETIPDVDGEPREGIIFNLVPLHADLTLLPTYGGAANYMWVGEWTPPEFSDIVVPQPELPELGDRVVSRVEFELQRSFGEWLIEAGHVPKLLRLPVGSSRIEPDLYVPSRSWIVEAKKSSGRAFVRAAIGQVLDYVHIAKREQITALPVILLPGRPEQDLVDLIDELGIILVYRRDDGFAVVESD
jgi:hypothetical protein